MMNANAVRLSVIVPFRNAAAFLEEALKPFESFRDSEQLELVFVDNGSTDASRVILEKAVERGLPAVLFNSAGEGPGQARNLGLAEARGQFIAFLDADDVVQADKLLVLCDWLESEEADLAIFNHRRLYPSGRIQANLRSCLLEAKQTKTTETEKLELLDNFNVAWNKIYRRSLIDRYQLSFPEGIYEDIPWSIGSLFAAERVITTSEILYTYRQHPTSALKLKGHPHLVLVEQYQRAIDFCLHHGCSPAWKQALVDRAVEHGILVAYKRKRMKRQLRIRFFYNLVKFISTNKGWQIARHSQRLDGWEKFSLLTRMAVVPEVRPFLRALLRKARLKRLGS